MALTLEWLLTSPDAFGLADAMPLQRAMCRAFDGLPLGELADHPDVIDAFGGVEAVAVLAPGFGVRPFQVWLVAATRSAKSIIGAAIAVRCALTADLETGTSDGDTFEVPILATKKKKAKIIFKHLKALFEKPAFKPLLSKEPTADTISIRRPTDRRIVDIVVTAGSRAGGASIGTWCAALVLDEAARMISEDEAVVNFEETVRYALSRIRPGGQIVAVTSPWAPMGPIYDGVQEHWGKPTADLVISRGKGPQMNPVAWSPEACEAIQRRDPIAYETDVLGNFADPVYGLFSPRDLERATRKGDGNLEPEGDWTYGAAMDPGTRSNAWTLVVVGRQDGETEATARYKVFFVRQWQGSSAEPLKAKVVFPEMVADLKPFGIGSATTDQWGYDPFREHAEDAGLDLILDERKEPEKTNGFESIRTMVVARPPLIELHPDRVFQKDLLNTKKKLTQSGIKIDHIKTSDGRHADYSPALERAIEAAGSGPGWIEAMRKWRERGPTYGPRSLASPP